MSTIELEQVKQRSRQVRELIRTQEALLAEQPGNFAQRLALSSLHSHLEDLHRQTLLLQADIKHELTDFRLVSDQVQVEECQTEIMELRGAVSLVSDAARLEIREDDKTRRTKIKYLKDKLPMIENLKVGQRVILEVERTSFFDKTEQKLVERYSLVNVLPQAVEN